jgi:malate dehydrogenase
MTVIGVNDIENAQGEIVVRPGDLLTPLARDRAKSLGLVIRSASAGHGRPRAPAKMELPALSSRPPGSPSAILYRRGGPVVPPEMAPHPVSPMPGDDRPKVAVIGAGHVGATTALRLAEADLFGEVALVDIAPGRAAGIALDLWHASSLARFTTRLTGAEDMAAITGAAYVVVTAGKPRQPGMSRTDLTEINADIVRSLGESIAAQALRAIVVVVTNPLEEMTHLMTRASGFPASRVIGMAGVLDSSRFRALIGLTGIARPQDVRAFALGSHGPEMVIPMSQAFAGDRPIAGLLDAGTLSGIVERTRDSGAEVVSFLKTGSAYFAPAESVAAMIRAMATNSRDIVAACVEPDGAYGLTNVRVGLPVRLDSTGVAEVVELALTADERQALAAAAARIAERVRKVG